MHIEASGYSDAGCVKPINQDSYVIKIAETKLGDVALVAVADGMGGLSQGELASATVVRELSDWFETVLPLSLETMDSSVCGFEQFVEGQWAGLIQHLNLKIIRYGIKKHSNLGTTLTAMLIVGARYSIVHVGDSRVYEICKDGVRQLTHDQTYVERELQAGRITAEEAKNHPQQHVLLQCIGSSREVKPEICHGSLKENTTYFLCSDGFRHELTKEELVWELSYPTLKNKWIPSGAKRGLNVSYPLITEHLDLLAKKLISRGEEDNLTGILLHAKKVNCK